MGGNWQGGGGGWPRRCGWMDGIGWLPGTGGVAHVNTTLNPRLDFQTSTTLQLLLGDSVVSDFRRLFGTDNKHFLRIDILGAAKGMDISSFVPVALSAVECTDSSHVLFHAALFGVLFPSHSTPRPRPIQQPSLSATAPPKMSYSMEDNQNAAPGNVVANKLGGGARKGGDQQAAKR